MSEPKKRVKSQEPGAKKSEAGMPNAEVKPDEVKAKKRKVKSVLKSDVNSEKPETEKPLGSNRQSPTELKELPTANSTQQTENMEVHHHPQLEHKPKPWKEYLLEGLMIFLAVFMGFVAESIRENITNSEHAKQLTLQLVRDLQTDTSTLNENILYERKIGERNDSLFTILQQPLEKIDRVKMQQLVLRAYNLKLFYPSLGAITAIKNELHIKQFANSKIAIYITGYEDRAKVLKELEDVQKRNLSTYVEDFFKDHFTPLNMKAAFIDEKSIINSDMRDLKPNDLTRFSIEITLIAGFNKDLISYDKKMKTDAVNLIDYVRKQYNLEDE